MPWRTAPRGPAPRFLRRGRVRIDAGIAISSVGNLLTGLAWAIAAAFLVQAIRGLGIAAMDIAVNTLLQRSDRPPGCFIF
jgi:hypothetical protein